MTIPDTVHDAVRAASAAAAASAVRIRELPDLDSIREVDDLFRVIWRPDPNNPPVSNELMRVLAHAGNYVVGAYLGDRLVGATVGFLATPIGRTLHSHVTGVSEGMRGRSVGFALKLHQRAWALERGLDTITWTFDPLVRRNAYFNLAKLAARAVQYLPDFYGEMGDDINGTGASDRLLVRWDLNAPEVAAACDGRPPPAAADGPLVPTPADIEGLRKTDPASADEWRLRLRESLGTYLSSGAEITGFTRDGAYVVEPL
ncbi:putative GNAT superfamily acetyltransferase [Saccharothrix tamanrassetensis]|uniref:Putative GNAT superfamily acetyltransferase n=1 Tax=Saccharothrix tamanrassetensis TaxID=1051531 RepID=A0A841CMW7_9PSEU|nr:GNAT family N-acetyltransferase [Saccharothrix tamanrassetensis]MBB5958649.1 putative GNAT superfamily acetyltransferase [Saccharothrix tamanrassetensis]